MECCYGDTCEHLPVALVKRKYCDGEIHHICQTKYEFTYGLNSDMVYICRPCIDKKYHDILEKAKKQADDETDLDGTVDLCGDNNGDNEAAANAVEVIDGANGAGVVTIETTNNIIASKKEATGEETTNDIITSDKEAVGEEKTDDIVQAAATAPTPCQITRGKAKRPTTARNPSTCAKKKKRANCKKGARVTICRNNLFHILKSDKQKEDIQKYGNIRNFHGEIISGNGKQGYNIKFDDLPADDQMVYVRQRNIIVVIEEGEEEVEYNHANVDLDTKVSVPKKDEHKKCITKFCDMGDEEIMNAKTFTLKDGTNEIVWNILPDGEYIKWDEIELDDETWKKCIELTDDTSLNDVFFMIFSLVLKDMPNNRSLSFFS